MLRHLMIGQSRALRHPGLYILSSLKQLCKEHILPCSAQPPQYKTCKRYLSNAFPPPRISQTFQIQDFVHGYNAGGMGVCNLCDESQVELFVLEEEGIACLFLLFINSSLLWPSPEVHGTPFLVGSYLVNFEPLLDF